MEYVELDFKVTPLQPWVDVLVAALGELGFESFAETKEGVQAYIPRTQFNASEVDTLDLLNQPGLKIEYTQVAHPDQNWNALWESNFQPIVVSDKCYVRAPFHAERPEIPYELVIQPQMSFGTGHHATTYLMLSALFDVNLKGSKVLDMGSGTAVLGILAKKLGAKEVTCIDIEEWAYHNAIENCARNNCADITVVQGDASYLGKTRYNTILANINRNVLLADMHTYVDVLEPGGLILFSGFYEADVPAIVLHAEKFGLVFDTQASRHEWAFLKMKKAEL